MTDLRSECYDGTSIVTFLDTDNHRVVVEHYDRFDMLTSQREVAYPANSANPEDHAAFEHRETWRQFNERKLTPC